MVITCNKEVRTMKQVHWSEHRYVRDWPDENILSNNRAQCRASVDGIGVSRLAPLALPLVHSDIMICKPFHKQLK